MKNFRRSLIALPLLITFTTTARAEHTYIYFDSEGTWVNDKLQVNCDDQGWMTSETFSNIQWDKHCTFVRYRAYQREGLLIPYPTDACLGQAHHDPVFSVAPSGGHFAGCL